MTPAEFEVAALGPCAIIKMPDEIDVTNTDLARSALLAAVKGSGCLIIDMTATTFCDSSGVQALLAAHRGATTAGTQIRLVAPAIGRILTLVGIDQLIPTYPTIQAAQGAAADG